MKSPHRPFAPSSVEARRVLFSFLFIIALVFPGTVHSEETESFSASKPAAEADGPVVTTPKYADFVWRARQRRKGLSSTSDSSGSVQDLSSMSVPALQEEPLR